MACKWLTVGKSRARGEMCHLCGAGASKSRTRNAHKHRAKADPLRSLRGATAPQTNAARSVQAELAVDGFDLGGLDQPRVCHGHRMQRSLELLQPEIEELVQL